MRFYVLTLICTILIADNINAFSNPSLYLSSGSRTKHLQAFQTEEKYRTEEVVVTKRAKKRVTVKVNNLQETTEKYGLEVGLIESAKSGDGGESAKTLLKKYGVAYLATSIPLAIVSLTICYFLVDSGVDVPSLLSRIGIETSNTAEKAGTFAIAYAAHKAASPIRFPPTVLLTPVVAKLIGKEETEEGK
mmetsp:Transcript_13775/g.15796  ORF Transcript_13775/g.15796 Transcript_13775/m.15796 type:complete len:190 (+) Transcript_13775:77-646(+)